MSRRRHVGIAEMGYRAAHRMNDGGAAIADRSACAEPSGFLDKRRFGRLAGARSTRHGTSHSTSGIHMNHDDRYLDRKRRSRRAFLGTLAAATGWAASPMLFGRSIPKTAVERNAILLVSTNVGTIGGNVSGTYLPEIAYPFQHFVDAGYAVDIVTPAGGKAALYDAGRLNDALVAIRDDERFATRTADTLAGRHVDPSRYAGIYYPGGHGQFFDVVGDERIARAATAIHAAGGIVGTAGHGTACLVDITLENSRAFVAGKRMTCFPTWAEHAWMNLSDYGRLLPFDMQQRLVERGADLVGCTPETKDDKTLTIVTDEANRLVTGSFASAAREVAQIMDRMIRARRT